MIQDPSIYEMLSENALFGFANGSPKSGSLVTWGFPGLSMHPMPSSLVP